MIENIIKFDNEEEMIKFKEDIQNKLPKYKEAFYKFHKDNNEKFPFDDKPFKDDLILVIFLNEYEYSHDIVLKALDEYLIPRIESIVDLSLVLYFLNGFGVLNKDEMNDRNIVTKILDKNLNIFS